MVGAIILACVPQLQTIIACLRWGRFSKWPPYPILLQFQGKRAYLKAKMNLFFFVLGLQYYISTSIKVGSNLSQVMVGGAFQNGCQFSFDNILGLKIHILKLKWILLVSIIHCQCCNRLVASIKSPQLSSSGSTMSNTTSFWSSVSSTSMSTSTCGIRSPSVH